MILVVDLRREGLLKNWVKPGLSERFATTDLEFIVGGFRKNCKRFREILALSSQADVVVLFALRPVELFLLSRLPPGVRVVLIQHGIFVPLMRRSLGGMNRKVEEGLLYAWCLVQMRELSCSNISWLLGRKHFKETRIYKEAERVDNVGIYSEYWKRYFQANFGVSRGFFPIGSPDFALYRDKVVKVDGLVYVAQTLVEDARLEMTSWKKFIDDLNNYLNTRKIQDLHVKLHPRTDKSLFREISDKVNVHFYQTRLPVSSIVLGHYSTLLGLYWMLGSNAITYLFDGHDVPEYIPGMRSSDMVNFAEPSMEGSAEYYFGESSVLLTKSFETIVNADSRLSG